jgi:energy-coupling factor transporter ATP-binding protein EcfA2
MAVDQDEQTLDDVEPESESIEEIEKEIESEANVITTIKENAYQTRPLIEWERMLRLSGIFSIKKHRIERWAWSPNANISNLVFMELYYAIEDESNSVIQIYAPPGLGKSTIGKSLAKYLKVKAQELLKLTHKTKIWLTWSIWETAEAIRKANQGDVIIQDEDKRGTGQGSQSSVYRLHNLLNTFRKKQISVIFISPDLVKLPNVVSFVVQAYSKNRQKQTNKVLILSGQTFNPIGHAYIARRIDKELENYEEIKDADIEKTIANAGFSVVEYPQDFVNKWVKEVWEELEVRFDEIPLDKWVTSIIDSIIQILAIPGDSSFRKIVADEIKLKIRIEKIRKEIAKEKRKEAERQKQMELQGQSDDEGHPLPPPTGNQEFTEYLQNVATHYLVENGLCESIEKARRWVIYKLTTTPVTYAEVCDILQIQDLRPDSIGRYIRGLKISNTHLGNILELALLGWIKANIPELHILKEGTEPGEGSDGKESQSSQDTPAFLLVRGGGAGMCDVHVTSGSWGHVVCMNAKLKVSEPRPSWTVLCQPEYDNNPDHSYVVLWDRSKGLQVYKGKKTELSSGSGEDIGMEGLLGIIKTAIAFKEVSELTK